MKFIVLETYNGDKVYVNVDNVRYISDDRGNEGMCHIALNGSSLYVKGKAEDIVGGIVRAEAITALADCLK